MVVLSRRTVPDYCRGVPVTIIKPHSNVKRIDVKHSQSLENILFEDVSYISSATYTMLYKARIQLYSCIVVQLSTRIVADCYPHYSITSTWRGECWTGRSRTASTCGECRYVPNRGVSP